MNTTAKPMEKISSLLTFQLGGQIFCTDMQNIVQIIDPSELDQDDILYSQDAHINLDSIKVPIIDLFKKAGVRQKNLSKDNRILIINIEHNSYGIWVEKVDNIYTLGHDLDVAIDFKGNEEILFLKGILKFKNMKMLFLDLKGISLAEKNIN